MEIRMDRDEHNNVNICFRDNGPGISAANVPRIFEPFFTTRPNQGGTGLGLAVAKRLAIAHGGDLTLQGNPEHKGSARDCFSPKGAVFCLSLPISHFNENSKDH
jgi:signal transduction histidine kinase